MRATRFEFANRFWVMCGIYFVGFALSIVDHRPFIVGLRHLIAPSIVRDSPPADAFARTVIVVGALLVFLSAALRTWAAAYLRTRIVHDSAQHSDALVADGPFRYVRNPLYLASLPIAAGIGVLASRSGFIFLVLANWIFVYRLIFREEEALQRTQGESYRNYLNAVPRFWPALHARVASSGRTPQWPQAFAGESFVWIFGFAQLAVAVTLNAWIGIIMFALAFVAHFVVIPRVRNAKPTADTAD